MLRPASFAVFGGECEAAIASHLHDHVDHVSIRQQSQQPADEAAVPYGVVGCCEIDKHSSGLLFSRKAVIDVLRQQVDLVYGRPPVTKTRVESPPAPVGAVGRHVDESLENIKGNKQQRYGTIAL